MKKKKKINDKSILKNKEKIIENNKMLIEIMENKMQKKIEKLLK